MHWLYQTANNIIGTLDTLWTLGVQISMCQVINLMFVVGISWLPHHNITLSSIVNNRGEITQSVVYIFMVTQVHHTYKKLSRWWLCKQTKSKEVKTEHVQPEHLVFAYWLLGVESVTSVC